MPELSSISVKEATMLTNLKTKLEASKIAVVTDPSKFITDKIAAIDFHLSRVKDRKVPADMTSMYQTLLAKKAALIAKPAETVSNTVATLDKRILDISAKLLTAEVSPIKEIK